MLRERPAWEGDAPATPSREQTRRLGDEPTTRLPDDERTARLFEDPSRADTTRLDETPTSPRGSVRGAHAPRAATRRHAAALGRRPPLTRPFSSRLQVVPDRPMTGREPLCRLHLPDRRARARAAPVLHAHDARRVRAPGRHAGLGRPQRRRDRQGPRRAHLHRRPRRRLPARVRRGPRASPSTPSRRAGAPPRPATSRTSSSEAATPGGFGVEVLRGAARRRRAALQDQPAAEVVPRHLPRLRRPRPRGDARRRAGAGADREEVLRAQLARASTSRSWPPPSAP